MFLLEEPKNAWLLVRHVHGDSHQIETTIAIHAEGILQVGELRHAGTTPRGPEADQRIAVASVGAQLFQALRVHQLHAEGRSIQLLLIGHAKSTLLPHFVEHPKTFV